MFTEQINNGRSHVRLLAVAAVAFLIFVSLYSSRQAQVTSTSKGFRKIEAKRKTNPEASGTATTLTSSLAPSPIPIIEIDDMLPFRHQPQDDDSNLLLKLVNHIRRKTSQESTSAHQALETNTTAMNSTNSSDPASVASVAIEPLPTVTMPNISLAVDATSIKGSDLQSSAAIGEHTPSAVGTTLPPETELVTSMLSDQIPPSATEQIGTSFLVSTSAGEPTAMPAVGEKGSSNNAVDQHASTPSPANSNSSAPDESGASAPPSAVTLIPSDEPLTLAPVDGSALSEPLRTSVVQDGQNETLPAVATADNVTAAENLTSTDNTTLDAVAPPAASLTTSIDNTTLPDGTTTINATERVVEPTTTGSSTSTPFAGPTATSDPFTLEYLDRLIGTDTWNTAVADVTTRPLINCTTSGLHQLTDNLEVSYEAVVQRLRGKHIMMMGDSTARYEYVNLAQYIQTQKWRAPDPQSEWERLFPSWDDFFRITSGRLKYEVCDCYRTPESFPSNVRENRYYRNPVLDINITMILQFGRLFLRAHTLEALNASCTVEEGCKSSIPPQTEIDYTKLMPMLNGTDPWVHFVCLMKPDVFIVNMGHWVSMDDRAEYVKRAGESIRECNGNRTRLIFRSTFPLCTLAVRGMRQEPRLRAWIESQEGRENGWRFMDSYSLLKDGNCTTNFMHDELHFTTNVVSLINRMMLVQLLGPEVLVKNPC